MYGLKSIAEIWDVMPNIYNQYTGYVFICVYNCRCMLYFGWATQK